MKGISYFFFYSYIGLVIVAGFWGAFINPVFDFRLLFHFDVWSINDFSSVNMLSQYRFLRAIELGFGLFAILFHDEIFSIRKFNFLFLFIMFSGISARIFSIIFDGIPGSLSFLFMGWEFVGFIFIFIYTQQQIHHHADH